MTATYHVTIPQYLSMGLAGALLTWQSAALVEHASTMQGMTTTMLIGIPLVGATPFNPNGVAAQMTFTRFRFGESQPLRGWLNIRSAYPG